MADLQQNVWNLNPWYAQTWAGNAAYEAPKDPGGIYGWGNNSYGKLGQNNTTQRSSPAQIGTTTNWVGFYVGDASVGVKLDGTMWSWGKNTYGELGLNNRTQYSSPKQIPGTNWSITSMIGNSAAATKTDNTLWTWGENNFGQLGLNAPNPSSKSSPTQIPGTWSTNIGSIIASGTSDFSFMAVKPDGTLWSWGNNYDGQLGLEIPTDQHRSSPTQIGTSTDWSDTDGQIGTPGRTAKGAIKTDGTLYMWGRNDEGALGQNNRTNYSSPRQVPGNYIWISKGLNQHDQKGVTFTIKNDTTMWAWGSGWYGMFGNNYGSASASGSGVTNYSSPVQCCGTSTGWAQVSHGSLGVLATKTDGTLWAWGYGGNGQLGLNQNLPSGRSSPCQIGTGAKWKFISSNNYSNGALLTY